MHIIHIHSTCTSPSFLSLFAPAILERRRGARKKRNAENKRRRSATATMYVHVVLSTLFVTSAVSCSREREGDKKREREREREREDETDQKMETSASLESGKAGGRPAFFSEGASIRLCTWLFWASFLDTAELLPFFRDTKAPQGTACRCTVPIDSYVAHRLGICTEKGSLPSFVSSPAEWGATPDGVRNTCTVRRSCTYTCTCSIKYVCSGREGVG